MLKPDRSELDYLALVRKAKRLSQPAGQCTKLALLGDVSTQHLVPLLRALFASNGLQAEVYEAGFDTVELEALNPASGLYSFGAQVVVILQSTMKLKSAYFSSAGD